MTKKSYPGIRVKRLKNGESYQVRARGPDGREYTRTFSRITHALAFQDSLRTDVRRGDWIDPRLGKIKFEDWVEEWWATSTHHLKPLTQEGYRSLLACHLLPAFGRLPLANVSTPHVKSWTAGLAEGLSPSRTRQAYRLLKMILTGSVESGYLSRNPCVGVKLPRLPEREMQLLNPSEIEALADSAGGYSVLILVLAYGGLRWSEAVGLRRRRCDPLRSRIEIVEAAVEVNGKLHFGPTKTYSRRSARLPRFVSAQLAEHLAGGKDVAPDSLTFTSPEGGPLRGPNFRRRIWKPALRKAGLFEGMRIHDLRHTCASLLIRQGASIKAVQEQLGHSTPSVTLDVYSHLFDDDLDRLYENLDQSYRPTG